jgi:hypothetical protein
MLPIWIVLGLFLFVPFVALGATIRPVWVPLGFAIAGSAIWIYGLGLGGFLASAIGATSGVIVGVYVRRLLTARRARVDAQRATAPESSSTPPPEAPRTDTSPGGSS